MRTVLKLLGVAGLVALAGCAQLQPVMQEPLAEATNEPLADHVEYMRRAAEADEETRKSMQTEAKRQSELSPLVARIRAGMLLTSPGESRVNTQEGERILRDIVNSEPGLSPQLQDLIGLRLKEVEAREALSVELKDIQRKIEELMSIESSMEQERIKSEQRPRQQ